MLVLLGLVFIATRLIYVLSKMLAVVRTPDVIKQPQGSGIVCARRVMLVSPPTVLRVKAVSNSQILKAKHPVRCAPALTKRQLPVTLIVCVKTVTTVRRLVAHVFS